MGLAGNEKAADEVRAIASLKVHELKEWLSGAQAGPAIADNAHLFFASKQIEQFEKDPKRLDLTPPAEPPDGPPIGAIGDVDDVWMGLRERKSRPGIIELKLCLLPVSGPRLRRY